MHQEGCGEHGYGVVVVGGGGGNACVLVVVCVCGGGGGVFKNLAFAGIAVA